MGVARRERFVNPPRPRMMRQDWITKLSARPSLKLASLQGRVVAVSRSLEKGIPKTNIPEGRLIEDCGLENDAHAGSGHRQLSLLALESIEKMRAAGADVHPGDFAENITTEGIQVEALPVGARLRVGDEVELEITQIGKACHKGCAIRELVGDCVMPREGVFARVIKGGLVRPGDAIKVVG